MPLKIKGKRKGISRSAPNEGTERPKQGARDRELRARRALVQAVMDRRLKPGTKLDEDVLADHFAISRTRLRKVLSELASQMIVTHKPNYGTFIAKPTAAEALEIFEARRGIEDYLLRIIAAKSALPDFGPLRRYVAEEQRAYDLKRAGAIELSGDFHMILADLAGNSVLSGYLHQLVTRTILIQVLYGPKHFCLVHEHAEILEALERGDASSAAERLSRHFDSIQGSCDLRDIDDEVVDLRAIFQDAAVATVSGSAATADAVAVSREHQT